MFQSYLYGIEIQHEERNGAWRKKFQSYLYGIEIQHEERNVTWRKSFNRTFMELKWAGGGLPLRVARKFQSYLYGIEILFVETL